MSAPARSSRCSEDDLAQHRMHSEWYELPQATVDAVAAARARRAAAWSRRHHQRCARWKRRPRRSGAARRAGETDLFITPGYRFRVVDRLLTNFHLPRSTLLMLVQRLRRIDAIRARVRPRDRRGATASSATATRCCWNATRLPARPPDAAARHDVCKSVAGQRQMGCVLSALQQKHASTGPFGANLPWHPAMNGLLLRELNR